MGLDDMKGTMMRRLTLTLTLALAACVALVALLSATTGEWRDGTVGRDFTDQVAP